VAVLNATPGAALANSYTTLAAATVFLTMYLNADAWEDASAEAQATALQQATRLLDQQVRWYGVPATATQALAWPQIGQTDTWGRPVASDIVPPVVQEATALYALSLLEALAAEEAGASAGTGDLVIKSKKVGDTTITYQDTGSSSTTARQAASPQAIPINAKRLLWHYGLVPGMGTVPLVRA
jgi:hypothetical protein